MIRRRDFITFVGGAAAAWPLAARGQQPAMPVIGYLSSASMTGDSGFHQGLKETGLAEGRDFVIEYRSTGNQSDRLQAIVADVVARRVTVILGRQLYFCAGGKGGNDSDTDRLY